jgi:hypothetical protein
VFEQSRGGRAKRTELLAADESLKVPQAQGARFMVVPGEGFGVLHELLEGQALLPDALFEQRPSRLIGQPFTSLRAERVCGVPMASGGHCRSGRPGDKIISARRGGERAGCPGAAPVRKRRRGSPARPGAAEPR